jgi:hypothetical protein
VNTSLDVWVPYIEREFVVDRKSVIIPSNTTKFYSSMTTCFALKRQSLGQHYKNF